MTGKVPRRPRPGGQPKTARIPRSIREARSVREARSKKQYYVIELKGQEELAGTRWTSFVLFNYIILLTKPPILKGEGTPKPYHNAATSPFFWKEKA